VREHHSLAALIFSKTRSRIRKIVKVDERMFALNKRPNNPVKMRGKRVCRSLSVQGSNRRFGHGLRRNSCTTAIEY
jgi:hypothetical protein